MNHAVPPDMTPGELLETLPDIYSCLECYARRFGKNAEGVPPEPQEYTFTREEAQVAVVAILHMGAGGQRDRKGYQLFVACPRCGSHLLQPGDRIQPAHFMEVEI